MQRVGNGCVWVLVCLLALVCTSAATAQVNTATLSGVVLDPQGLAVKGAKVTVTNSGTGIARVTTSDENGRYSFVGLPPGQYKLAVDSAGFTPYQGSALELTVGQAGTLDVKLSLGGMAQTVAVSAETSLVETQKTDVSSTIDSRQITNLPIDGRNYINFTLLNSQTSRDQTPSIGAAPTSGLNFGGQRARSNEVSVDGADAVDNSINGVRSTVSQEAVQEFQVITSNYMPEYGRAMGGVVNIVTKSGGNDIHGDIFGFLRHSSLQARNPFSVKVVANPQTGFAAVPVKQSFTRVQSGATLGGPIQKDKTFYFLSYEITRRQETGFSSIGSNNFGLVNAPAPAGACPVTGITTGLLTSSQATFVANSPAPVPLREGYFCAAAASSAVALFGNTAGFPLNFFPSSGAPLPASYVGLSSIIGNFPISEGTSLYSAKIDHTWNPQNASFLRVSISPSTLSGIEVNAENQNFGQNAGSRTSVQQTRDISLVGQHTTAIGTNLFNEFRFQFARRGLHYGFSNLPGGDRVAVNIIGVAFFGREPFATEDRIERRYEWTDNLTWTKGSHAIKVGVDTNLIQLRSAKSQIFTLNYGGVYSFGGLDAGNLNPNFGAAGAPGFSSVQAYGLGLPALFIQGIGQSKRPFDNKTLGVFAQDSWKINRKLTLNYGARYDIEWMASFAPGTTLNAAGEKAFNVVEGIPTDTNNIAPRIGLAWDPWGNGKTVVRAGYGFFYDHPALALAFLSTAEDGAMSTLLETGPGAPSNAPIDNPANFAALNASSIFQGILTGPTITGCSTSTPQICYLPNEQRFNAFFPNSLFNNQNFLTANGGVGFPLPLLPFTIPIEKDFQYALAQQANFSVEREIAKSWKVSVGYNYTHGTHLDRAINLNVTNPALLVKNANNAILAGFDPPGTNPLGVTLPAPVLCASNAGSFGSYSSTPVLVALFPAGNTTCSGAPVTFVGAPAVFNFFRPSGPNPSFAGLVPGGYNTLVQLASEAGFPIGFPGVQIPWSDVNPQASNGNSVYHAFTLSVTKHFSNNFELLSSWTYSHTIDDSTDLSTLLNPQDNNFPNLDRGNSNFDQRHRWITSAVFLSPHYGSGSGLFKRIVEDFTFAPVIEVAAGRPFNVLIGSNPNLDFGTATNRPSVLPAGASVPAGFPPAVASPFIEGVEFILPTRCIDSAGAPFGPLPAAASPPFGCTGDLGRNAFTRPGFFQIDLRLARKFSIYGERAKLELIADGFNMLNRFNVSDVSPLCDPTSGSCTAGQPTAALQPRTFQFALRLNW